MAQDSNRFVCEGCGKQFENRNDLQTHTQNCQALKASQGGSHGSQRGSQGSQPGQGGSDRPKTKTAGGQGMPESQE
jgi:hypothetical protein